MPRPPAFLARLVAASATACDGLLRLLKLRPPVGASRSSADLGRRGERIARRFLRRQGCRILARNYRGPEGEIDLIALEPARIGGMGMDTLVFVEVKLRSDDSHVAPFSAVDAAKRRRIRRTAAYYLSGRDARDLALRYDILSIVLPPGERPRVQQLKGEF
jgi:putative endonuclease